MRDFHFKCKNIGEWTYGEVEDGMDKMRAPVTAGCVLESEAQL